MARRTSPSSQRRAEQAGLWCRWRVNPARMLHMALWLAHGRLCRLPSTGLRGWRCRLQRCHWCSARTAPQLLTRAAGGGKSA
eukprot:11257637-Alexandrium_andersonii.AAC.1